MFGDSKTALNTANQTWPEGLRAAAVTATGNALFSKYVRGIQGGTLANFASGISTATIPEAIQAGVFPTVICVDYGTNDVLQGLTVTLAMFQTAVDALHGWVPEVLIYVSKPWCRGFDSQCDALATVIDNLIASRSFTRLADDQRTWVKGADNGAAMTIDGIHYSTAGQAEKLAQMKTVLGY